MAACAIDSWTASKPSRRLGSIAVATPVKSSRKLGSPLTASRRNLNSAPKTASASVDSVSRRTAKMRVPKLIATFD
jgi:hypothetical protein